ncbi:hypothetical protein [Bacteroides acidifaciens]|jgi:lipoprotein|uniref:hypothetical protein n=1 Tax=Bacteroides acidifaciens TaxID=85831 RepID=UPI002630BA1C|nr:hypothetical protein [Bacteroides acidifaciens]
MKTNLFLPIFAILAYILTSCEGNGRAVSETECDSIARVEVNPVVEQEPQWSLNYFIDEFGEKTNDGYILHTCNGEFSNSATTNSRLLVKIIVTPEQIRFDTFEYGSQKMKGEDLLEYRAKLPDDSEVRFSTWDDDEGFNIVSSYDLDKVMELFKNYDRIRFAARTNNRYSVSTYRFVYEGSASDFKTELSKLESK